MGFSGCCGQVGKTARRPSPARLSANPAVVGGVKMIYVGAGYAEVKGQQSGLTYFLSDHRRHFSAAAEDVKELLRNRDFMLQP